MAFFASSIFASIFDPFGVGFGAVLASQMAPGGGVRTVQIGRCAVQDGLGIVLVRSFFRLAVWIRFFGPLGLVLGSFWGALGVVLEPLGVIFEPLGDHFWAAEVVLGSLAHRPYFASTHQPIHSFHHPIIPSTRQPSSRGRSAIDTPARRTARCAIRINFKISNKKTTYLTSINFLAC